MNDTLGGGGRNNSTLAIPVEWAKCEKVRGGRYNDHLPVTWAWLPHVFAAIVGKPSSSRPTQPPCSFSTLKQSRYLFGSRIPDWWWIFLNINLYLFKQFCFWKYPHTSSSRTNVCSAQPFCSIQSALHRGRQRDRTFPEIFHGRLNNYSHRFYRLSLVSRTYLLHGYAASYCSKCSIHLLRRRRQRYRYQPVFTLNDQWRSAISA